MNAATITAISKVLESQAKAARKDLAPGKYDVRVRVAVDVAATVTVSEDETYTPTTSIPIKAALALFMRYSGVTGPKAMDALVQAMTEAAAMDSKAAKRIPEVANIEAAEARVREGLQALPKETRNGKVTVKGEAAILGVEFTSPSEPEAEAAE